MTVALTERNDGGRIRVRVGDTIEIFLPENASTGYRWSVDDLDSSLFDVAGASAEYPGQTIGAGGQACVRITVRGKGIGTVRLSYRRPWEGADATLKQFTVEVEVVPG
jgi:predicted secreted protein